MSAYDKGPAEEVTLQVDWYTLRQTWAAAKVYSLAKLHHLLDRYEAHQAEKHKQFMAKLPPHNLLCEKRCCQKSYRTYMRFLQKELVWGPDGHLQ